MVTPISVANTCPKKPNRAISFLPKLMCTKFEPSFKLLCQQYIFQSCVIKYLCLYLDVSIAFNNDFISVCEGNISEEVCLEVTEVPSGGLGCDIQVTLNFTGNSASKYKIR